MTVRNLDALFRPKSVAVIGASLRPGSLGAMVWARVLEGGFAGPVWPVNPKYAELSGLVAFGDVHDLPEPPTVYRLGIPQPIVDAVMRSLAKEPDARFQSAEEFMSALPDLPAANATARPADASGTMALEYSPPMSAQPASRQPSATPLTTATAWSESIEPSAR